MRSYRHAVLVLVLSVAGAGLAAPALADVLPVPVPVLPTSPPPSAVPSKAPTVPGVPTVPTVPGLPGLPVLPGVPTIPGLPGVPARPGPAKAGPAGPLADFGYLPWGHYVDDGLGTSVTRIAPDPVPNYTLPPEQPYDKTGYDLTDYTSAPSRTHAAPQQSLVAAAFSAVSGHLLLDVLAVGLLAGVAGRIIARRRRLPD